MSYLDDPRVFFAAERTLLAWQRTAIAIIGLGLIVARFGLYLGGGAVGTAERSHMSLAVAVLFLLTGACTAAISTWQYKRFLRDLSAPELPRGHLTWPGPALNTLLAAASVGMALWLVLNV
jgi:putative membrane protein